ncbi:glycosyltransferase family protein [Gallaecimonas kandeliae]|uniref:glycosyltransferase family protein n=1 Tax=Gallaecimonas kandeliae TaxID=3029055 RepID=UPI00264A3021|nr:glycosyltransferase family protein [Gallaecimonas kandeliae]WKE66732.1 glycosyltransferase family protein [Gallaecimonas kandeliae]
MILAILQARMSSSRLPGKVMADILGMPMIGRQLERLARCRNIDKLLVATSTDESDDPLADWLAHEGIAFYRGDLKDVLGRFAAAARPYQPSQVVRLTADCPLADPQVIDQLIAQHLAGGFDYSSNCWDPSFPDGLDAEILSYDWLKRLDAQAQAPMEREHVTYYFRSHEQEIHRGELRREPPRAELRLTVDNPEDLALVRAIYQALYPGNPQFTTEDVVAFLDAHPALAQSNQHLERNAGSQTKE